MSIEYRKGDCIAGAQEWATDLPGALHVIAHGCNDIGAWGAGFTAALDRVDPDIGRRWRQEGPRRLGSTLFLAPDRIEPVVANLVTQHGVGIRNGEIPFRYWALGRSLDGMRDTILAVGGRKQRTYVHMPRIGCGLAGADWTQVEPYLIELSLHEQFQVVVWDL